MLACEDTGELGAGANPELDVDAVEMRFNCLWADEERRACLLVRRTPTNDQRQLKFLWRKPTQTVFPDRLNNLTGRLQLDAGARDPGSRIQSLERPKGRMQARSRI